MLDLAEYVLSSPDNYIRSDYALSPELVGKPIYTAPLMGVAAADDAYFSVLQERRAVGPWFRKPEDWLPGAKSVISVFFPYSDAVKAAEDVTVPEVSPFWLHARYEGNDFLFKVIRALRDSLEQEGYRAVIPSASKEFFSVWAPGSSDKLADPAVGFTSAWSERHVAFVCGLGTFGLSGGLITEKGVCGRFGSIVTDAVLPVTPRRYTEVYEYCTRCGVCAAHCPVGAIDIEKGKDHRPCGERINATKIAYAPRYGCGKCQIAVPCSSGIPKR